VALRTARMDESIAFYRRYAGLHLVHERVDAGVRVVWLSHRATDPELVIVLLELPFERAAEPQPSDHLGFDVGSRAEVDRIAALARREGCLKHEPTDGGPIVGYFCMLRDPSGNACEFSFGQPINPRDLG
jgi:catechol 2,3-dioxygenase-like lactoylglutathione lyase family enzyme